MRSANCSGGLAIEKVTAGARNFSRNAGSPKIFCVSALSLSTISRGVPLGAARPYHEPASKPGSPLSRQRRQIGILRQALPAADARAP